MLLANQALAVGLDDTTYHNGQLGIRLHAPHGWKIHRQAGYPSMLAVMVSPDGVGTINLATGHLSPGQTIKQYVDGNCSAMRLVGLRVEQCGPATLGRHKIMRSLSRSWNNLTEVRQVYIKSRGRVFILTLGCPRRLTGRFRSKLLQVLDTVTIDEETNSRVSGDQSRDTATRGKRIKGGSGRDALPELGQPSAPRLKGGPLPDLTSGPATQPGSKQAPPASRPATQPAKKPLPGDGSRPGVQDLPEMEALPEMEEEPLPKKE